MKYRLMESQRTYCGACMQCHCTVYDVMHDEIEILTDRDSPDGAKYIECPNPDCNSMYVWMTEEEPIRNKAAGSFKNIV